MASIFVDFDIFSKRELRLSLRLLFLLISTFYVSQVFAVPRPGNQSSYSPQDALQETKDTLSNLRYQVSNHEHEIREFDEKLKSLDAIIDSLRDEHSNSFKTHKEQLKSSKETTEEKISSLESISNGLSADLRQFKTCVNDSALAIGAIKQKIGELEKVVEQQNQNIGHLQGAMRSLMEALQGKPAAKNSGESIDISSENTYRIKAGDSLEKIAKANQTTVQVIKELNQLTSDKIVVGKVLRLPEKKAE